MTGFEMGIDADAFSRTFGGYLFIDGRVAVIDLRQKSLKYEMSGFFAAGEFFAQPAAHASDAAHFAHARPLVGIGAENVYRSGRGHKLDDALGTGAHAFAAADAKALIDFGEPVDYAYCVFGADVGTCAVTETAVFAAFVAAGRRGRHAAVADSVVVADANRLGTRSAALDYGNAPFRAGSVDTENIRNFRRSVRRYRGARADGSRTRDKRAGITVAPGKTASAAIGAGERGSNHSDPRIFANAQIFIREGE